MNDGLLELVEAFLETELGVDLSAEAVVAADSVTEDQMRLLVSHVMSWDQEYHETLAKPVTREDEQLQKEVDSKQRPFSAMFTHPYNGLKSPEINQVKRQLLFFPKIAVVRPELTLSRDASLHRFSLKAFVAALIDLQDSLRDGSVEFIPISGFYSNEIEGGAGLVREGCQTDSALVEWLQQNQELVADFSKDARRGDPYFDAGIRIASSLTYGHEFVATHPLVGLLYEKLLGRGQLDRQAMAIGSALEKLSLPRLDDLDWRDIKMIRRDESSFRKWRADLSDIIASVDPTLPPDEFVKRFNDLATARLTRAAIDLDEDIKKSAALTRARKGVVTFGIGAIAAASTLTTFDIPTGATVWSVLLQAAQTVGITAALQFLWGTKRIAGKKALRSHYSVFLDK